VAGLKEGALVSLWERLRGGNSGPGGGSGVDIDKRAFEVFHQKMSEHDALTKAWRSRSDADANSNAVSREDIEGEREELDRAMQVSYCRILFICSFFSPRCRQTLLFVSHNTVALNGFLFFLYVVPPSLCLLVFGIGIVIQDWKVRVDALVPLADAVSPRFAATIADIEELL